jgi:hypothetical protein
MSTTSSTTDRTEPQGAVGGEELLQFLRVAYAAPDEATGGRSGEANAELSGDLVDFLRDFSATAPRRLVKAAVAADQQAPRRVLLAEGRGRWRAPVALASLAAASALFELRPAPTAPLRVPPYITELTGRGWIASSAAPATRAAS